MTFRIRWAAFSLAVIVLASFASACSTGPIEDAAAPTPTAASQTSKDATAQAAATLASFFAAWQAKDAKAVVSHLAEGRRGISWQFKGLDRVVFGPITPDPGQIAGYMTNGTGFTTKASPGDIRCFKATATFYFKNGQDGTVPNGEQLDWDWFLERDDKAGWLVTDWGY